MLDFRSKLHVFASFALLAQFSCALGKKEPENPQNSLISVYQNSLISAVYSDDNLLAEQNASKIADLNFEILEYGDTPLIVAAFRNNIKLAEYLVSKGAKIFLRNKFDKTALDYAEIAGHKSLVKKLREWAKANKEKNTSVSKTLATDFNNSSPGKGREFLYKVHQHLPDSRHLCLIDSHTTSLDTDKLVSFIKKNCSDKSIFDLRYLNLHDISFLKDLNSKSFEYLNLIGNPIKDRSALKDINIKILFVDGETEEIGKKNEFWKEFNLTPYLDGKIPSSYDFVHPNNDSTKTILLGKGALGNVFLINDKLGNHYVLKVISEHNFRTWAYYPDMKKLLADEERAANEYFRLFKNPYFTKAYSDINIKSFVRGKTLEQLVDDGWLFNGSPEANLVTHKLMEFFKIYYKRNLYNKDGHWENLIYSEEFGVWIFIDCDTLIEKHGKAFIEFLDKYINLKSSKKNYSSSFIAYRHAQLSEILKNIAEN